ncbi:hypothetical protein JCM8547_002511 [Rhodosporidiobolus lusitaniae]
MEKFSQWRDKSTGLAPFVPALPPTVEALPPTLHYALLPFAAVWGGARVLLVALLLCVQFVLVEGILRVFAVVPPVHAVLTRATNLSTTRFALILLGLLWIKVETVQLRKTGRSPPQIAFDPKKGDLIVANSSSYIDLLYLAFRYNPTFLLPIPSASAPGKVSGFRRVSLLTAILACGQLPQQRSNGGQSLDQVLREADGPVVLFPEATTSNNRALLKFAELTPSLAGSAATGQPVSARVFVLTFRYPAPTRFARTLTYPIPTPSPVVGLLIHLYSLTSLLSLNTFTVRRLHASESPRLTLSAGGMPRKEDWDVLSDTLAGTARLKRVGGLGWVEKRAFLEFRRLKGR